TAASAAAAASFTSAATTSAATAASAATTTSATAATAAITFGVHGCEIGLERRSIDRERHRYRREGDRAHGNRAPKDLPEWLGHLDLPNQDWWGMAVMYRAEFRRSVLRRDRRR
ncbi:MAG: hypothetical protein ACREF6_02605, partial [Alphaproteobacteria bacterium]